MIKRGMVLSVSPHQCPHFHRSVRGYGKSSAKAMISFLFYVCVCVLCAHSSWKGGTLSNAFISRDVSNQISGLLSVSPSLQAAPMDESER